MSHGVAARAWRSVDSGAHRRLRYARRGRGVLALAYSSTRRIEASWENIMSVRNISYLEAAALASYISSRAFMAASCHKSVREARPSRAWEKRFDIAPHRIIRRALKWHEKCDGASTSCQQRIGGGGVNRAQARIISSKNNLVIMTPSNRHQHFAGAHMSSIALLAGESSPAARPRRSQCSAARRRRHEVIMVSSRVLHRRK